MTPMPYCAEIYVPNGPGMRDRCVMLGCYRASEPEAVKASIEAILCYRVNGVGYEGTYARICRLCTVCGGTGRVQRMRRKKPVPFGIDPCGACLTSGTLWELIERVQP